MEIEIDSKKNNPLLNRTEVYFTIEHLGEKTPNREIIKTELAEKLNVKKEDVIVDSVHTSYGSQKVSGYAKIYTSPDKLKGLEREHILIRNKLMQSKKKEKKEAPKAAKPAEIAKVEAKPAKEEPEVKAPKTEPPKKEEPKEKPSEPQHKEKKE